MKLSSVEADFLGDLARDNHELWELYSFIRLHHRNFSEDEVILHGLELLQTWLDKGWLKGFSSRTKENVLSKSEFLNLIKQLGKKASDPVNGVIALELTEFGLKEIRRND